MSFQECEISLSILEEVKLYNPEFIDIQQFNLVYTQPVAAETVNELFHRVSEEGAHYFPHAPDM